MFPKSPKSKSTSTASIQAQLDQIENLENPTSPFFSFTDSEEDINEQKEVLKAAFLFAKTYAQNSGDKVTRAKTDGTPSKVIAQNRTVITIPKDIAIPQLTNSIINYQGKHYLFLEGDVFYNDAGDNYNNPNNDPKKSSRGLRRGKLAIDEKGNTFFVKIIEHAKGSAYAEHLHSESKSEIEIAHSLAKAPHGDITTREDQETIKIYSITPYEGQSSYDMVKENLLSPAQVMDLAVQYMQSVYLLKKAGIIHRDLKPENFAIVVSDEGQLELNVIDYGLARRAPDGSYEIGTDHACGTQDFLSPRFKEIYRQNQEELHRVAEINKDITEEGQKETPHLQPYTYNFATEMYAAAQSAKMILQDLKAQLVIKYQNDGIETLTQDGRELFDNISQTANKILSLKCFPAGSASPLVIDDTDAGITPSHLQDQLRGLKEQTAQLITDQTNEKISLDSDSDSGLTTSASYSSRGRTNTQASAALDENAQDALYAFRNNLLNAIEAQKKVLVKSKRLSTLFNSSQRPLDEKEKVIFDILADNIGHASNISTIATIMISFRAEIFETFKNPSLIQSILENQQLRLPLLKYVPGFDIKKPEADLTKQQILKDFLSEPLKSQNTKLQKMLKLEQENPIGFQAMQQKIHEQYQKAEKAIAAPPSAPVK
jgi:serine/threonine protein kinase